MKKAIALFVFNRPDETERTLAAIAGYQPEILFIIGDAPRTSRPMEQVEVAQVRRICRNITWKCDVRYNWADENMGCGLRISTGIDWVFTQVEEAIFLEDDCLPSPAFFTFAQKGLDKFRDNHKISQISGHLPFGIEVTTESHAFSDIHCIWGWATWKNRWHNRYDYRIPFRNEAKFLLRMLSIHTIGFLYWLRLLSRLDKVDTWDHQWSAVNWRGGTFAVVPGKNLIGNIGFGRNATHTTIQVKQATPDNNFFIEKFTEKPIRSSRLYNIRYTLNLILAGMRGKAFK